MHGKYIYISLFFVDKHHNDEFINSPIAILSLNICSLKTSFSSELITVSPRLDSHRCHTEQLSSQAIDD
jgi:hypothetical protein